MSKQKYNKGDHVMIADDLGQHMSHFVSGVEAIVIGTYAEQYGGTDVDSYTLHLKGRGQTSWYHEHQLSLIEAGREDMLVEWVAEEEKHKAKISDLDWIFENGKDVVERCEGYTAQALYTAIGGGSLWGTMGEGVTYFANARAVLQLATPYLLAGDKQGFLDLAAEPNKAHGAADYDIAAVEEDQFKTAKKHGW